VYTSDSLEVILSQLSTRVTNFIVNGDGLECLEFLLGFLLAWEKRPRCLTPMTYWWCSAFFEPAESGAPFQTQLQYMFTGSINRKFLPSQNATFEQVFNRVGHICDPIRLGDTSHHTREPPRKWVNFGYPRSLFLMILEVGFRLAVPEPALCLYHAPHRDLVFKRTFSSDDDEAIADGVCAWIADSDHEPAGLCLHYLAERVERARPFSPRLRRMCISLIEHMGIHMSWVPEAETICLLNYIKVGVDDIEHEDWWAFFLVDVICSPAGFEGLSIHYWHLMDRLPPTSGFPIISAMELVRLLEEAEDWEKLEAWMAFTWRACCYWEQLEEPTLLEHLEHLKQVTFKHLLRRPSALPRFEAIPMKEPQADQYTALEDICTQIRAKQLPLEPPSP